MHIEYELIIKDPSVPDPVQHLVVARGHNILKLTESLFVVDEGHNNCKVTVGRIPGKPEAGSQG